MSNSNIHFNLTKQIARELNLIEVVYVNNPSTSKGIENSSFQYLIVIDFESTCWKEKHGYLPEIIEFPAVLINMSTGIIEEEFQQYVMPSENPILSEFCTNLTGISQGDVENGIPLGTCLLIFSDWIKQISERRNLAFHERQLGSNGQNICTFVTWSDWDLSVCLHNECARKRLHKPEILCQWIDIRATYRQFYKRQPQGLRGALSEVGLPFEGREHSGLCDARNTAFLAMRMVRDGVNLKITKNLKKSTRTFVTAATHSASNMLQRKRDSMKAENEVLAISRPPLKTLNLSKCVQTLNISTNEQKKRFTNAGDSNSLVGTPVSFKKFHNLRRQVLTSKNVNSPKSAFTSAVIKKNGSELHNMRTPNAADRPSPSSSCKRTPPLCNCGCRSSRKIVFMPGPNQGRSFFTCSKRKSLGMVKSNGCGFFRWDS